jgi:menaquinone-dependent protoporphyrinogen oxidase
MNLPASPAPVLVAYGSKHGATAEIAAHIADVLRQQGVAVDLRAAATAGAPEHYRAVVLGSAVYMRRWRRDARRLLRRLEHADPALPVWLFSSGPFGDMPADAAKLTPRRVLAARCREHVLFGGCAPQEPSNPMERALVKNTPPDKRDRRDWVAIDAWAAGIAHALEPAGTALAS